MLTFVVGLAVGACIGFCIVALIVIENENRKGG